MTDCDLTCLVFVILRAMICTVREVASCIVNVSNKELSVFGRNLYDTDETNSIFEIRLDLYCPVFEEMKSSFLTVADFLSLCVVTLLILI